MRCKISEVEVSLEYLHAICRVLLINIAAAGILKSQQQATSRLHEAKNAAGLLRSATVACTSASKPERSLSKQSSCANAGALRFFLAVGEAGVSSKE